MVTKKKTKGRSQSARFIAAAKKAEVDMSGRKFARAVKKLTANRRPQTKP